MLLGPILGFSLQVTKNYIFVNQILLPVITKYEYPPLDKIPVKELLTHMNYNDVKEPFDNQLSFNLF